MPPSAPSASNGEMIRLVPELALADQPGTVALTGRPVR